MGVSLKVNRVAFLERTSRMSLEAASLPRLKSTAAQFARDNIEQARSINAGVFGRSPPDVTSVDGRPGAPLDSVNPFNGVILTEFEVVTDVLLWILTMLKDRSPVQSGAYRLAHTLFAGAEEVLDLNNIPPADEYSFMNLVPYARKIEFGKTESGRTFTINANNAHVYESTAQVANRRFGNIARIKYTMRAVVGGGIHAWADTGRAKIWARAHGRRRDVEEWLRRQPAITVSLKG